MIDSTCFNRYLQSGSDVITTATYQASIAGFVKYLGLRPEEAQQIIMSGVFNWQKRQSVSSCLTHPYQVCSLALLNQEFYLVSEQNVETPATLNLKNE